MDQKIISGYFYYCVKMMKPLQDRGYVIVKSKKWADNKYTYVLERIGDA